MEKIYGKILTIIILSAVIITVWMGFTKIGIFPNYFHIRILCPGNLCEFCPEIEKAKLEGVSLIIEKTKNGCPVCPEGTSFQIYTSSLPDNDAVFMRCVNELPPSI